MKGVVIYIIVFLVTNSYGAGHISESGSGSGSGSGSAMSCADITCSGGGTCIIGMSGPYCQCPIGKKLVVNNIYLCEECPAGYWGNDCSKRCSDTCGMGRTESCDSVNGTCTCNKCWVLDNGTCSISQAGTEGYQCFLDYTMSISKSLTMYGGDIPQPQEGKLLSLAKQLTKSNDITVIQADSVKLEVINRDDVGARKLAKFYFTVLNQGSTDYNNAISAIKTDVKDGDYRATLVIDESDGETAKVTLNV